MKRTPGNDAQTRAVPADAGGEVGRTDAVARFARHELLHDAILERVEGDDREPATGSKDPERGREAFLDVHELVVDGDAQGLEHARRRVDASAARLLHARDEAPEIRGRLERPLHPSARYGRGDARGLGLLAVFGEDARELALVVAVHHLVRGHREVRVGAHVQRAFRAEAEAAVLVSELDGREAEVEKGAVSAEKAMRAGHVVENREVVTDKDGAIAERSKSLARDIESPPVDVEAEEPALGRRALEDRCR